MIRTKTLIALLASVFILDSAFAQFGAGVKVTEKQDAEKLDSLKTSEYPYIFPILGARASKKGFLLPYPMGIMVNSFLGRQDVTVSDLTVGITDASGADVLGPLDLDQVVGFSRVRANIYNVNARADLWILPFFDVYGIVGQAWATTNVDIGTIAGQPVDFSTQAKFSGQVYGVGGMLMGGIHSWFGSADFNCVWTHFKKLENSNNALNLSFRAGYVLHLKKPQHNLVVWTGAARSFLNNTTRGSMALSDVAPDMGQNYTNQTWYQNLGPLEKQLADKVVANFTDKNQGDIINYSLSKRPSHNWSMIIGAQFQLDRRWQFRTEYNFLGGRASALLSANYRFGIGR